MGSCNTEGCARIIIEGHGPCWAFPLFNDEAQPDKVLFVSLGKSGGVAFLDEQNSNIISFDKLPELSQAIVLKSYNKFINDFIDEHISDFRTEK